MVERKGKDVMVSDALEKVAKRALRRSAVSPRIPVEPVAGLLRIGTHYGRSIIPKNLLTHESVCILAGAGEDISFDVGIVRRYDCRAIIFDPTPKAKEHFDELVRRTNHGERMPVNNSRRIYYSLDRSNLENLQFEPVGLWKSNGTCRFYMPARDNHASFSLLDLHRTGRYIEAPVERLGHAMDRLGLRRLDLLKLDIAGAEYAVLESLIMDRLEVDTICVEYVEYNTPAGPGAQARIEQSVRLLLDANYVAAHVDANCNVTFIKKRICGRLLTCHGAENV